MANEGGERQIASEVPFQGEKMMIEISFKLTMTVLING